jgi:thiosulfate/3-mercaptopyruvate sulfurtransferase
MPFRTLIDTAALAAHLDARDWVVVDCRFRLDDPLWGEREYRAGHVPGAVFADLDRDLSGAKTGSNGRHPLPDVAAFLETLGRFGIGGSVQVVAYDQTNGMFASRLWWMLRWLGHEDVAVLDGGFQKWVAEGREVTPGAEFRARRVFHGAPRPDLTVDAKEVAMLAQRRGWTLVDARAPERYRGEVEPIDRVAGHIPGAVNHPFTENLDDRGMFRPVDEIRRRLAPFVAGESSDRVVCYCGSGVTACHNLLALEHAGFHGAKLYPGSWSEWSSDPTRPVSVQKKRPDPEDPA